MIFKHTHTWVTGVSPHTGEPKTQTRRPCSYAEDVVLLEGMKTWRVRDGMYHRDGVSILSVRRQDRTLYETHRTYAVQPGRGVKAVARVLIEHIGFSMVAEDISEEDARAEGFATPDDFRQVWRALYGERGLALPCWILTLKLEGGKVIEFDEKNGVVVMDLVDLEHCGFDHEAYDFELDCRGIEGRAARFPFAIIVNVSGGHLVLAGTPEEQLQAYRERQQEFERWVQTVLRLKQYEARVRETLDSIIECSDGGWDECRYCGSEKYPVDAEGKRLRREDRVEMERAVDFRIPHTVWCPVTVVNELRVQLQQLGEESADAV